MHKIVILVFQFDKLPYLSTNKPRRFHAWKSLRSNHREIGKSTSIFIISVDYFHFYLLSYQLCILPGIDHYNLFHLVGLSTFFSDRVFNVFLEGRAKF